MRVEVDVTLVEVNGARTKGSIVARDEKDTIGEGTRERFSINGQKFRKIVTQKADNT